MKETIMKSKNCVCFFIDVQAINDPILQQRILDKPESFYLKQNREGGKYEIENSL